MIGISHIPYCYCYLVAMVTKRYLNNSFVLSSTGFIFDIWRFLRMISTSHIPCYYGNSVFMAARVKPGSKQHPELLSA